MACCIPACLHTRAQRACVSQLGSSASLAAVTVLWITASDIMSRLLSPIRNLLASDPTMIKEKSSPVFRYREPVLACGPKVHRPKGARHARQVKHAFARQAASSVSLGCPAAVLPPLAYPESLSHSLPNAKLRLPVLPPVQPRSQAVIHFRDKAHALRALAETPVH